MNDIVSNVAIGAAVAANAACMVWHIRMRRRAAATWRDAADAAQLAYLQARVIGECRELLCDDCLTIVEGHYVASVGPAFEEWEQKR